MESHFNNRDFEQFVKQNADQYRMFPSEKVWTGIHTALHGRSRWYGIGLALLFLTGVTVTWVMLAPNGRNGQLADHLPVVSTSSIVKAEVPGENANSPTPGKEITSRSKYLPSTENQERNLFIAEVEPEAAQEAVEALPVSTTISQPLASIVSTEQAIAPVNRQAAPEYVYSKSIPVAKATAPLLLNTENSVALSTQDNFTLKEPAPAKETVNETSVAAVRDPNLLTIESVTNSYIRINKKNKFYLQAYFTPTISYRRLQENNEFISAARSTTSNTTLAIADINSVVEHKPDIGLQLGVNAGYRLNTRFTLITGLQFNINKYDIRAYTYPSEKATIALITGNVRPRTMEKETTYRNYSGNRNANWLHNLYFSASVPIGAEMRLSALSKKTEIGVGGTIQPTYVLGNRTYLLSTDYKNYAEVPSLVRKWNVSAGLEAYASYSTGKLNWRIGPQVRYQLLSSFDRQYPVKEHLFDFGLKIGVMLNK